MNTDDKILIGFLVTLALGVALLFTLVFGLANDDLWHESTNGCYIHEVHNNHLFSPDVKTVTLLCPKE